MPSSRQPRAGALPVSLIGGLPGEWKSILVRHVVAKAHPADLRISILLSDLDEFNIAPDLIKERAEGVVRLQNGYCCRRFPADTPVSSVLMAIAEDRKVDYCIVLYDLPDGVTTIADDVAEEDVLSVDTCVTVVDAKRFHSDLASGGKAMSRWKKLEPDVATRDVAEVLAEQLEQADMILVANGADAGELQTSKVANAVRAFNISAPVKCLQHVDVDVTDIVCTKRYSQDSVGNYKRWLHEIRISEDAESGKEDGKTPKEECVKGYDVAQRENAECDVQGAVVENGGESKRSVERRNEVVSIVYKRRRPFHPVRFARTAAVHMQGDTLPLRSKGFLWLATRHNMYGEWSQAGSAWTLQPGGLWLCATPRERWPSQDPSFVRQVEADFAPEFGDRRQEIAFIGIESEFNRDALVKKLDACLLTDDEWAKGQDAWKGYEDPFPEWIVDDEEDEVVSDDSEDVGLDSASIAGSINADNERGKDEAVEEQLSLDDTTIGNTNSKRKFSSADDSDPSKRARST